MSWNVWSHLQTEAIGENGLSSTATSFTRGRLYTRRHSTGSPGAKGTRGNMTAAGAVGQEHLELLNRAGFLI